MNTEEKGEVVPDGESVGIEKREEDDEREQEMKVEKN